MIEHIGDSALFGTILSISLSAHGRARRRPIGLAKAEVSAARQGDSNAHRYRIRRVQLHEETAGALGMGLIGKWPIGPVRISRRLAWAVADIRRLLAGESWGIGDRFSAPLPALSKSGYTAHIRRGKQKAQPVRAGLSA